MNPSNAVTVFLEESRAVQEYERYYQRNLESFLAYVTTCVQSAAPLNKPCCEYWLNQMELSLLILVQAHLASDSPEALLEASVYSALLAQAFFIQHCKKSFQLVQKPDFITELSDRFSPVVADIIVHVYPELGTRLVSSNSKVDEVRPPMLAFTAALSAFNKHEGDGVTESKASEKSTETIGILSQVTGGASGGAPSVMPAAKEGASSSSLYYAGLNDIRGLHQHIYIGMKTVIEEATNDVGTQLSIAWKFGQRLRDCFQHLNPYIENQTAFNYLMEQLSASIKFRVELNDYLQREMERQWQSDYKAVQVIAQKAIAALDTNPGQQLNEIDRLLRHYSAVASPRSESLSDRERAFLLQERAHFEQVISAGSRERDRLCTEISGVDALLQGAKSLTTEERDFLAHERAHFQQQLDEHDKRMPPRELDSLESHCEDRKRSESLSGALAAGVQQGFARINALLNRLGIKQWISQIDWLHFERLGEEVLTGLWKVRNESDQEVRFTVAERSTLGGVLQLWMDHQGGDIKLSTQVLATWLLCNSYHANGDAGCVSELVLEWFTIHQNLRVESKLVNISWYLLGHAALLSNHPILAARCFACVESLPEEDETAALAMSLSSAFEPGFWEQSIADRRKCISALAKPTEETRSVMVAPMMEGGIEYEEVIEHKDEWPVWQEIAVCSHVSPAKVNPDTSAPTPTFP